MHNKKQKHLTIVFLFTLISTINVFAGKHRQTSNDANGKKTIKNSNQNSSNAKRNHKKKGKIGDGCRIH